MLFEVYCAADKRFLFLRIYALEASYLPLRRMLGFVVMAMTS